MSVWSVKTQAQATFTQINGGFDAVLGARSSKLQLVLKLLGLSQFRVGFRFWGGAHAG